jgi:hypothetical protein
MSRAVDVARGAKARRRLGRGVIEPDQRPRNARILAPPIHGLDEYLRVVAKIGTAPSRIAMVGLVKPEA